MCPDTSFSFPFADYQQGTSRVGKEGKKEEGRKQEGRNKRMKEPRFEELTTAKIKAIVTCVEKRGMTVRDTARFLWYDELAIVEGYRIALNKGMAQGLSRKQRAKRRAIGDPLGEKLSPAWKKEKRSNEKGQKGKSLKERLKEEADDCFRKRKGLPENWKRRDRRREEGCL